MKVAATPYHSALHPPEKAARAFHWTGPRASVAFSSPLVSDRLPKAYAGVDVLYCEPPWAAGYDEFNRRAEAAVGTSYVMPYGSWVETLDAAVRRLRKPAVLIVGKKTLRYMTPDWTQETRLNGAKAIAACYNLPSDLLAGCMTETGILYTLAETFRRVGDPCCGYGRAGRMFASKGGSFVMSDSNPECIGMVATRAAEWFR